MRRNTEFRSTVIQDTTTLREASATSTPPLNVEKKPRIRLEFLDGLRGLAALYVAFSHIIADDTTGLPQALRSFLTIFSHGRLAVDVFIVLSGFCLMLPVAQSADGHLRGGVASYLKRRARRILPPYYAALILTLAVILASHAGINFLRGGHDSILAFDFSAGNLITHALLVHNLSPAYNMSINGPMWSVATEWQIYFIFPALMLPIYRKSGIAAALAAAVIVGALPHFLLPSGYNLDWACPWYIGLFTLGMTGAVICFRGGNIIKTNARTGSWLIGAAIAVAAVCGAMEFANYERFAIVIDTIMGAGTVALIVYCASHASEARERHPWILKLLDSRWAIVLGTFSYSLYLTHRIAMMKLYPVLNALHLSPLLNHLALLCVGIPWVLLFAYVFHLLFERRFMTAPRPAGPKDIAFRAGGEQAQTR